MTTPASPAARTASMSRRITSISAGVKTKLPARGLTIARTGTFAVEAAWMKP